MDKTELLEKTLFTYRTAKLYTALRIIECLRLPITERKCDGCMKKSVCKGIQEAIW